MASLTEINHRRVLVKVDWNIPDLDHISRIERSLDTLVKLLGQDNFVYVVTHWGRPVGRDMRLSTQAMVPILQRLLQDRGLGRVPVGWYDPSVDNFTGLGSAYSTPVLCICENTRFISAETVLSQDSDFIQLSKRYAGMVDCFVNEGFSVSHRKEVTNWGVSQLLDPYTGLLFDQEVKHVDEFVTDTGTPLVCVLGGAKLETKISLLESIGPFVDTILVGGLIALELMDAKLGNGSDLSQQVINRFGTKLVLPPFELLEGDARFDLPEDMYSVWQDVLQGSARVVWNGPLGKYEDGYRQGSEWLRDTLWSMTDTRVLIGGGDTESLIDYSTAPSHVWVSSGGGAMLDYLVNRFVAS